MKEYVLNIVGAVLIASVTTIVLPNGKIGLLIQRMSKLLIVLFLIAPIVSFCMKGEFLFLTTQITYDREILDSATALAEQSDERYIETVLYETFQVRTEVKVVMSKDGTYTIEKIVVKIDDFGINDSNVHIDIVTKIQEMLCENYDCVIEVEA